MAPVSSATPIYDPANLDRTCPACRDFRQFATGGWIAKHPLPPSRGEFGTFDVLAEHNRDISHDILETAAKNQSPSGDEQRIGGLYAACMDTAAIDRAGLQPLTSLFARIDATSDLPSLIATLAELHRLEIDAFWLTTSQIDVKNSERQIAVIVPAGLTLPDRDYYTRGDADSVNLRVQYGRHVGAMLRLAGDDPDRTVGEAQTIVRVETEMAKAQLTLVQRRDPDNIYHRTSRADLARDAPHVDWNRYFAQLDFPAFSELNLSEPQYLRALDGQLASTPLADLKLYLRWRVLVSYASWLSRPFAGEDFAFAAKLNGAKVEPPRWERCVQLVDSELGDALGQAWVRRAFPPEAKARADAMVANIVDALRDDLQTLPWLSEPTRAQALAKLAAMHRKIGYPDRWRDYSGLTIDRSALLPSIQHADVFDFTYEIAKIGKPVDKNEFGMTPQTVNAYYSPARNEIVFPAGILQPPYFDYRTGADDAINYGGIGAVIGHEMTHGFDDQGRRYDERGNLRDWWTPQDVTAFNVRAQCFVDEFSDFKVGGTKLDGKLVEGEAIADLGGLRLSYRAFQRSQTGMPQVTLDGFTPEQRFFLGFAQIWASTTSAELERTLALTDTHPPDKYRVNGTVENMPEFAQAFGCSAKDAMVRPPAQRCQMW